MSWFESFLEEYFTFIVKSSWNKIVGRVFHIYSQNIWLLLKNGPGRWYDLAYFELTSVASLFTCDKFALEKLFLTQSYPHMLTYMMVVT